MDGWKKVDSFQMLPDAEFHKAALEAEGVEVLLRNVHANSLRGELPFLETDI